MATIETPGWHATHLAVHREDLIGNKGRRELALLRHAGYPFRADIDSHPDALFGELRDVANAYLLRLGPLDRPLLKAQWLLAGPQKDVIGFGWLPISWGGPGGLQDPRGSFVVRRQTADGHSGQDCSVVLMAANRKIDGAEIGLVNATQSGLRVVMHLAPTPSSARLAVRVTGLSCSGLRQAQKPLGPKSPPLVQALMTLRPLTIQRAGQAFGFVDDSTTVSGFELLSRSVIRVAGGGVRIGIDGSRNAFLWQLDLRPQGPPWTAVVVGSPQLVAQVSEGLQGGDVPACLFLQDPASMDVLATLVERLPTRDEALLDRCRQPAALPATLQDPSPAPRFQVLQSLVADRYNDPASVQQIDPTQLPLRGDHLAAAHAYQRASELFKLISDFGLQPESYFKFAKLPLQLRHRASFDARPSGKSVNAQVQVVGSPLEWLQRDQGDKRPQLAVRFGAAELRHRNLRGNDNGWLTAQPLGLAADPRWAWHEFGHVLSYAATGALEFQFAHSAGDALAAVLNDPLSRLASVADAPARGDTFPWVRTGRRHDRDAAAGWCWCGRRNGMRHAPLVFPPLLYKGYIEEQMLSSSIFRFYRAIGGDTFDAIGQAQGARARAARRCAYLVLRAILLLGPGALVPVRSADAFVSALVDADIGSSDVGGQLDHYPGGCLHKVVRWAFERQGLFATAQPDADAEGLGRPPAVDLWLQDMRLPDGGSGGYDPVPLRWGAARAEPWHASHEALAWADDGRLKVTVHNRGEQAATAVEVRVWSAAAAAGPLSWLLLGRASVRQIAGGGHAEVLLKAIGAKPVKPHYLLAEASCPEDRSNLDPAAAQPCAADRPPANQDQVLDLVANDNNLGLRRFDR